MDAYCCIYYVTSYGVLIYTHLSIKLIRPGSSAVWAISHVIAIEVVGGSDPFWVTTNFPRDLYWELPFLDNCSYTTVLHNKKYLKRLTQKDTMAISFLPHIYLSIACLSGYYRRWIEILHFWVLLFFFSPKKLNYRVIYIWCL